MGQVFPGPVWLLLDNQNVFQPFWDVLNNPRADGSIPDHWREAFDDARQRSGEIDWQFLYQCLV